MYSDSCSHHLWACVFPLGCFAAPRLRSDQSILPFRACGWNCLAAYNWEIKIFKIMICTRFQSCLAGLSKLLELQVMLSALLYFFFRTGSFLCFAHGQEPCVLSGRFMKPGEHLHNKHLSRQQAFHSPLCCYTPLYVNSDIAQHRIAYSYIYLTFMTHGGPIILLKTLKVVSKPSPYQGKLFLEVKRAPRFHQGKHQVLFMMQFGWNHEGLMLTSVYRWAVLKTYLYIFGKGKRLGWICAA